MMRGWLRHRLHALSIVATLIRWGLPRSAALAIGCWWERRVHPVLYHCPAGLGPQRRPVLEVSNGE